MPSPAPFITVYRVYQQNPHLRMLHTQTGLTGETSAMLLQAFHSFPNLYTSEDNLAESVARLLMRPADTQKGASDHV